MSLLHIHKILTALRKNKIKLGPKLTQKLLQRGNRQDTSPTI